METFEFDSGEIVVHPQTGGGVELSVGDSYPPVAIVRLDEEQAQRLARSIVWNARGDGRGTTLSEFVGLVRSAGAENATVFEETDGNVCISLMANLDYDSPEVIIEGSESQRMHERLVYADPDK